MSNFILGADYLYKGGLNSYLTFVDNDTGTVDIYNVWDEKMITVTSACELTKFVSELLNGKYA